VASESNTIRIGTQGTNNGQQDATYVAGVYNGFVSMESTDLVVCVNPLGGLYGAVPGAPATCAISFSPNELQKEHAVVMAQQDELQAQLQQIKSQRQEIDGLKHELQLQNASLQERLSKLESYVATQTQMKTASDVQPVTTASPSGDSQ
jgi:hypothetical protein